MDKKYEWLLFDLDNTLMDFHAASEIAFTELMHDYGLLDNEIDYALYHEINGKVWHDFETGKIDALTLRGRRFDEYFDAVKVHPKTGIQANYDYLNIVAQHPIMIKGAYELLEVLAPHYKMAIITNGLKEVQRKRLDAAKITSYFECIIVSDEIGWAKPHTSYFEHTIEQMEYKDKSKMLVIGDSLLSDILGANKSGIDSCWHNLKGKPNKTVAVPTYEVSNLAELQVLLTH